MQRGGATYRRWGGASLIFRSLGEKFSLRVVAMAWEYKLKDGRALWLLANVGYFAAMSKLTLAIIHLITLVVYGDGAAGKNRPLAGVAKEFANAHMTTVATGLLVYNSYSFSALWGGWVIIKTASQHQALI